MAKVPGFIRKAPSFCFVMRNVDFSCRSTLWIRTRAVGSRFPALRGLAEPWESRMEAADGEAAGGEAEGKPAVSAVSGSILKEPASNGSNKLPWDSLVGAVRRGNKGRWLRRNTRIRKTGEAVPCCPFYLGFAV